MWRRKIALKNFVLQVYLILYFTNPSRIFCAYNNGNEVLLKGGTASLMFKNNTINSKSNYEELESPIKFLKHKIAVRSVEKGANDLTIGISSIETLVQEIGLTTITTSEPETSTIESTISLTSDGATSEILSTVTTEVETDPTKTSVGLTESTFTEGTTEGTFRTVITEVETDPTKTSVDLTESTFTEGTTEFPTEGTFRTVTTEVETDPTKTSVDLTESTFTEGTTEFPTEGTFRTVTTEVETDPTKTSVSLTESTFTEGTTEFPTEGTFSTITTEVETSPSTIGTPEVETMVSESTTEEKASSPITTIETTTEFEPTEDNCLNKVTFEKFEIKSRTSESMEIIWKTTENYYNCVDKINVTWLDDDKNESFEELTFKIESSFNITNLKPCGKYSIEIKLVGPEEKFIVNSNQIEGNTDSIAPSSVTLTLKSEANMINVTWSMPVRGMVCLEGYQIAYKLHSTETYEIIDEIIDKSETAYEIHDLLYCNEYDVVIKPIGEEENGTVTKETTTTEFKAPSEVREFTLSIENGNGIKVDWKEPAIASECVTVYQIFCKLENLPESEPIATNVSKSPYVFKDLDFCSDYQIEIQPLGEKNNSGNSRWESITTTSTDVDEVRNLRTTPSSDSILIQWDAPKEAACVESYKVTYTAEQINQKQENITKDTNITYINLEPCVEYNISVQAIAKDEKQSKYRCTEQKTGDAQPSEVLNIAVEEMEFALNISWTPPKVARFCVKNYAIQFKDLEPEFSETESKMIRKLSACAHYDFTITPVVSDSLQGIPASDEGKTLPSVTNAANLLVDPKPDKKSADLIYELDISNNQCELINATTICKSNSNEEEHRVESVTPLNNDLPGEQTLNFTVQLKNLLPFTKYACQTSVNNINGRSKETYTEIKTLADVPGRPILKSPTNVGTNSFTIFWEKSQSIPGDNYSETLEIEELSPNYFIPMEDCIYPPKKEPLIVTFDNGNTEFEYTNASPYTEYIIRIRGQTEAGVGPQAEQTLLTHPSAPSQVRDLEGHVVYNETINISYPHVIRLTWNTPCNSSGVLQGFQIKLDEQNLTVHAAIENKTSYTFDIKQVIPEYRHKIEVYALTQNPKGDPLFSQTYSTEISTPAGVPSYKKDYFKKIDVDPYNTNDPEHKVQVKFSRHIFGEEMGTIRFYSIIVSQSGFEGSQQFEGWNDTGDNWIQFDKWSIDPKTPYQATAKRWSPFENNQEHAIFIIGLMNCNGNEDNFCNGPLSPNINYSVRIRGFTSNGFSDTPSIYFQTAMAFNVGVIIAVVISLFIFGTCLSFAIYFKNGNASIWVKSIFLCKDISTSMSQSTVMPPRISVQNFPGHCSMLRTNENQLSSEFSLLSTLSDDIALLTYTGDLPHNRVKNRYPNIKPYDVTRVKLRVVPDDYSDYINASYIKGASSDVEYIATQGPKEETIDDFWQMVYENDVKQIVMVTNLTEKGKNKCYKYYPEELDPVTCSNGIELECEFTEFKQALTIRHIALKKKNHPYIIERKVVHLQFHEWPDFGVPQSTDSVLKLCREIRTLQAQNYGVILVHCSAGVGRTGTIIAIDILLQAVHANRKIDVFGTVFNLRKQRQYMVKNEGQYAFIYNCLRDEILNPRVFKETDRQSSYTSFYDHGYYDIYDDVDLRKLSTESAM